MIELSYSRPSITSPSSAEKRGKAKAGIVDSDYVGHRGREENYLKDLLAP